MKRCSYEYDRDLGPRRNFGAKNALSPPGVVGESQQKEDREVRINISAKQTAGLCQRINERKKKNDGRCVKVKVDQPSLPSLKRTRATHKILNREWERESWGWIGGGVPGENDCQRGDC